MSKELYGVTRISFLLGVRKETVKLWIKTGKLKTIGTEGENKYLVDEESFKTFLENNPKYIRDYFQNKKKIEPDVIEIPRDVAEDLYEVISKLRNLFGGRELMHIEYDLKKALRQDEEE